MPPTPVLRRFLRRYQAVREPLERYVNRYARPPAGDPVALELLELAFCWLIQYGDMERAAEHLDAVFWADLKEGGGLPDRARLDARLREYCRDLARAEAAYGPRLRRLYARVRALLCV